MPEIIESANALGKEPLRRTGRRTDKSMLLEMAFCWGYRNYDTPDNSRNNLLMGLVARGDGRHNNHHAHEQIAAHGRRLCELGPSYWMVCRLERLGLATNVNRLSGSNSSLPKA